MRLTIFVFLLCVLYASGRRRNRRQCHESPLADRGKDVPVIFTGTVEKVYRRRRSLVYRGTVRVRRVIKGNPDTLYNQSVIVNGFGNPHICRSDVRLRDTRIFLLGSDNDGRLELNSSLARVTLRNLIKTGLSNYGQPDLKPSLYRYTLFPNQTHDSSNSRSTATTSDVPFKKRPLLNEAFCDEKKMCAYGSTCVEHKESRSAECQCDITCTNVFTPVCGSDDITYANECKLGFASCKQQKFIQVRSPGSCDSTDPCASKKCPHHSTCVIQMDGTNAECLCPEKCARYGDDRGSQSVCGTDGVDYPLVCELKRAACTQMKDIQIKYYGLCDPCDGINCPANQVCQLERNRKHVCRCNDVCSKEHDPVCGSDGKTYSNECQMRVEACQSRKSSLRVIYKGQCSSRVNPCHSVQCHQGEYCQIDRHGIAHCHCPDKCEAVMKPVCGTDMHTYDNECELKRQSCIRRLSVDIKYRGICSESGPCSLHECDFGATCVEYKGHPRCECPTCTAEFSPVCGSNGITYNNECKLRRENCELERNVDLAYSGLCNGCEKKRCDYYSLCESDGNGNAVCVCPEQCVNVNATVCGSDGVSYTNECELKVNACKTEKNVMVESRGACDLCKDVHCKFGARCDNGNCVCPMECPDRYDPLCGSNGITYSNECYLKRAECQMGTDLVVASYGECEDIITNSGNGGSGLTPISCELGDCVRFGGTCIEDIDFDPTIPGSGPKCICDFECESSADVTSVCGSDNKIYQSHCHMRENQCKLLTDINWQPMHACIDSTKIVPCGGLPPLVDEITGEDLECRSNSENCPTDGYCHKSPHGLFAKCCKQVLTIRSCGDSQYGCCPDMKTSALGQKYAGCPSVCMCNIIGSDDETCDPITRQCPCRPGVGGLRCNRCEPGFWGLHMIAEGNSGCIPCGCSVFGSVRDDCEQMTGRCVCKIGVTGMKCNQCSSGQVLTPSGCQNADLSVPPPKDCSQLNCLFGARCAANKYDGKPGCVCDIQCLNDKLDRQNEQPVCGSDGQTYGSKCQLGQFSCRYQKDIVVSGLGPCRTRLSPTRAPNQRKRGSRRKQNRNKSNKATRHIQHEDNGNKVNSIDSKNNKTNKTQSLNNPLSNASKVVSTIDVPAFSGSSHFSLRKMRGYKQLKIHVNFRTYSNDGIILYNGQNTNGNGDFVSLAVKDGYVEFRYDLGNGPVIIKSSQKIQLNRMHKILAQRYLQDGFLELDGVSTVGKSQGMLKGLNLRTDLFIGNIPSKNNRIEQNIGVKSGLVGCIQKLKIGKREMDIKYPNSRDIKSAANIVECSDSPCSSIACRNGATCAGSVEKGYSCICLPNYTGRRCENTMDACSNEPCGSGSTCTPVPNKLGYMCACPDGSTGSNCNTLVNPNIVETFTPDFKTKSYLQLPRLRKVGRAFRIEIWFLVRSLDGMILYNGQLVDGQGDFISLNLVDGYLQFRFNLGSGICNITSTERVTLNKWHSARIQRKHRKGLLQLDNHRIIHGQSEGSLTQLNLRQPFFLGGYRGRISAESGISQGMDGAIQRIVVNGDTYDDIVTKARRTFRVSRYEGPPCYGKANNPCLNGGVCTPKLGNFTCKCPLKHMGKLCERMMSDENVKRPIQFNGVTHMRYHTDSSQKMKNRSRIDNRQRGKKSNKFKIKLKTIKSNGLLIWMNRGSSIRSDFLGVAVRNGHVEFSYNLGKQRQFYAIKSNERIDDNRWHTIHINRRKRLGSVQIDNNIPVMNVSSVGATHLNTHGIFWLGGSNSLPYGLPVEYHQGFEGCISEVVADDKELDFQIGDPNIKFCSVRN